MLSAIDYLDSFMQPSAPVFALRCLSALDLQFGSRR